MSDDVENGTWGSEMGASEKRRERGAEGESTYLIGGLKKRKRE